MSKKTLYILLLIIGIFAMGRGAMIVKKRMDVVVEKIEILKNIDIAHVEEIEISKGEGKVFLKRVGELWKVGDKDADEEKVRSALASLANARYTGPIARTKENHERMGIGEQGTYVAVKQQGSTFEFIIGNGGPTFNSVYIRLKNEDAVYLADVNFGVQFTSLESSWVPQREGKDNMEEKVQ